MTISRNIRCGWLVLVAGLLACLMGAAAVGQATRPAAGAVEPAEAAGAVVEDAADEAAMGQPDEANEPAGDEAADVEQEEVDLPEVKVRVQHVGPLRAVLVECDRVAA